MPEQIKVTILKRRDYTVGKGGQTRPQPCLHSSPYSNLPVSCQQRPGIMERALAATEPLPGGLEARLLFSFFLPHDYDKGIAVCVSECNVGM